MKPTVLFTIIAIFGLIQSGYSQNGASAVPTISLSWVTETNEKLSKLENELKENARIPVGTIVAFWGDDAPAGWLACDGSTIPAAFEALRKIVGKQTPDFRGLFLRGLNQGRSDGKGDSEANRKLGTYQKDTIVDHSHSIQMPAYNNEKSGRDQNGLFTLDKSAPLGKSNTKGVNDKTNATGETIISDQVAPRNVAILWIIKH